MPFQLEHDVSCYGYLIRHDECGQVVFITDTLYSHYRFKGLNQIIVEANYSEAILEDHAQSGTVIPKVRDRVIGSHMSLETCRDFLRSNDLSRVRNIILIHLSSTNSNASQFRDDIQQLTGRSVHVAKAGLRVNLNLNPF
jgi:ribonuclease BN (tRNA processing enzyme)